MNVDIVVMNDIIRYLKDKNWQRIIESIEKNKIDWDYLVDQINGMLHYLAYHGKTDLIKLIDQDTIEKIINKQNIEGDTVCHIAAKMKNIELLNLSINLNNSILYEKNKLMCTPLFYIVSDLKLTRQIVDSIKIEDCYLNNEYTLMEYYILSKNYDMIVYLLKNIKINKFTNNALFTIITTYDASVDFKIKLLKLFVKYSVDVNHLNKKMMSPLIISTYLKEFEISKFLLDNGADINYYGFENNDHPLTIAIKSLNVPMIKLFLEYEIKINVLDKYLQTSVHHIFSTPNKIPIEIKQFMLNKTRDINSIDNRMNSILNLLIQNDNWKNYRNILKDKKLKIYLRNKDGVRPLDNITTSDLDDFYKLVYKSYLNQLDSDIEWIDDVDKTISLILENGNDLQSYTGYIMGKIIGGQSYPLKKSKNKMIKLITPPKTNITHFSAYTYNYICFLYYVLEKYPKIKIPSMIPNQMKNKTLKMFYDELVDDYKEETSDNAIIRSIIRDYVNHSPVLINHVIIWKNNNVYFFSPYIVQGINETIKKYPDTQFILLKITILTDEKFNHANILIFDIENNYIERFDPYGEVSLNYSKQIDHFLEVFFKKEFPNIKYLSPTHLVNGISFQTFSDERNNTNYVENDPIGFCIAWCLWYIEMRMKNLRIHPRSLIRRTIIKINKRNEKFKDYIRNYSNNLDSKKNNILEKAGIPRKYWYTRHIPIKIYKAYLKYIRNIYNLIS